MVVQEPAQHPGVVVAERGAAGGDRGRHAGQVAGHHVGVALDDDRLRGAGDVAAGQVDAVEHLALLVDRGLGGVEVLRLDPVVVEDPAGAEADRVAAGVADRPQQPAAEPVVAPTRPLADQPGGDQLLLGEALLAQVLQQRLAVARREADAERARRPSWSKPRSARNCRADERVGRGQLLGVELLGEPGWPRSAGCAAGRVGRSSRTSPSSRRSWTPYLSASRSTASVKASPSIFIRKVMTSPPSSQPKQWKKPRAGRDVERRGLLVVEGAQALQRAAAGVAEGDVLARRPRRCAPARAPRAMSSSRIRPATRASLRVDRESGRAVWGRRRRHQVRACQADRGGVGQRGDLVDRPPAAGPASSAAAAPVVGERPVERVRAARRAARRPARRAARAGGPSAATRSSACIT